MNKLERAEEFKRRTKEFAINIIRLVRKLPKTEEARIISRQLLKAGTSVASNYRAACRGRSRKEFIAKLGIVIEEADETVFWLEMIRDAGIYTSELLEYLLQESEEILAIVSKSKITASKGLNH